MLFQMINSRGRRLGAYERVASSMAVGVDRT
jgi:hypothetical protein